MKNECCVSEYHLYCPYILLVKDTLTCMSIPCLFKIEKLLELISPYATPIPLILDRLKEKK